jgi:hypothetical protein
VADLRERRASLTEAEKRTEYRSGITSVTDYDLDYDRLAQENDTRRAQLVDLVATVGDQYEDWVRGNHAVMNAVHNLDWMGWDQDNLVNIVTRYASRPDEHILSNYSTEDGGRNFDGMIARDEASGEHTYIENIPDSEVMDGDAVNFLTTDMENLRMLKEEGEMTADGWETTQITMQSIVPGIYGPSIHADRSEDHNMVFDGDALSYIGENYDESAGLANEVSKEGLEVKMSTEDVRNSGRYIRVTAGEDGLEIDAIYSQEEGRERLREPINL